MRSFSSIVFIENGLAQYQIKREGYKFIAELKYTSSPVRKPPSEIVLWKERGSWKSSQPLTYNSLLDITNEIEKYME